MTVVNTLKPMLIVAIVSGIGYGVSSRLNRRPERRLPGRQVGKATPRFKWAKGRWPGQTLPPLGPAAGTPAAPVPTTGAASGAAGRSLHRSPWPAPPPSAAGAAAHRADNGDAGPGGQSRLASRRTGRMPLRAGGPIVSSRPAIARSRRDTIWTPADLSEGLQQLTRLVRQPTTLPPPNSNNSTSCSTNWRER